MGSAYHNYHHVFPYDYNACEYGLSQAFNFNTLVLDVCAKLGLVTNRKRASQSAIDHWKRKYGNESEAQLKRDAILDWTIGMLFSVWPIWVSMLVKVALYGTLH